MSEGQGPPAAERRDRERLAELERELLDALVIVAALVVKYGEDSAQGDRVARISDAILADMRREAPTMYREDASGVLALRVRP